MARNNDQLVSKSVRLPESLIEYIELQEGGSFSSKLVHYLMECRSGEAERRKNLEFYDKMIAERQDKLKTSTDNLNQCILILNKLSHLYTISLED